MKSQKKMILNYIVILFLVTSCASSTEVSKVTKVVVHLSESENCDLNSTTVRENQGSHLSLTINCDIEDDFRYGKFLARLYEMLEKEGVSYQQYNILNKKGEEKISLEYEDLEVVLKKKQLFESTLELLKNNETNAVVSNFNTDIIGITDSTLMEALHNKYNLNGEILVSGFQIGNHEFELGKEVYTLITFSGRDEDNVQITATFNLSSKDDKLYGIEF